MYTWFSVSNLAFVIFPFAFVVWTFFSTLRPANGKKAGCFPSRKLALSTACGLRPSLGLLLCYLVAETFQIPHCI